MVATWTTSIPVPVSDGLPVSLDRSASVDALLAVSDFSGMSQKPKELMTSAMTSSMTSSMTNNNHHGSLDQSNLTSSFNSAYSSEPIADAGIKYSETVMKNQETSTADLNLTNFDDYIPHQSMTTIVGLKSVSSVTTVSSTYPSTDNTYTTRVIPTVPTVVTKPTNIPVMSETVVTQSMPTCVHNSTVSMANSTVTSVPNSIRGVSPVTILPITQPSTVGNGSTVGAGVDNSTQVSMKNIVTTTSNIPIIPTTANPVLEFDPYVPAMSTYNIVDTFSQTSEHTTTSIHARGDAWPLNYSGGYTSSIPDSECSSRAGSPTQLTPAGSVENFRTALAQANLSSIGGAKVDENVPSKPSSSTQSQQQQLQQRSRTSSATGLNQTVVPETILQYVIGSDDYAKIRAKQKKDLDALKRSTMKNSQR
jgi:hypothetical protein